MIVTFDGFERSPLVDRSTQPDPIPCEGCRADIYHTWIEPRYPASLITPRWVAGSQPCRACGAEFEQSDRADRIARLQKQARIPLKLRGYRIDRFLTQDRNECADDFQQRVRRNGDALGIYSANAELSLFLQDWKPKRYQSLLLHGPQGCGKTLLCCAWANSQLANTDSRVEVDPKIDQRLEALPEAAGAFARYRGLHKRHSGERVYPVSCVTEAALVHEERLSWKGNQSPLLKVSRRFVLILDELMALRRLEWAVDYIEKLVCYRYDRGLPMLITTNADPGEGCWGDRVAAYYGDRVAGRLVEMVGDRAWFVSGPSWRRYA